MIEARGLGRRFGDVVALDDLSLRVPDGAVLALLGPNGAGKTTTVRLLAGLLAPTAGQACVAGVDVRADPAAVRARVGLVTDLPGVHDQMTPLAYLDFFGRVYGLDAAARHRRINELLGRLELRVVGRERMAGFSRGMQQKVALARALLHEPPVVFLDEPTANLDPLAARTVRGMIGELKAAGRTVVLCTHDLDEADRLADDVAILRRGRLVAHGSPAAVRAGTGPTTLVRIALAGPCAGALETVGRVEGASDAALAADGLIVSYRTAAPERTNPVVVAALVAAGAAIVSATCASGTLEDAYAAAVGAAPSPYPLPEGEELPRGASGRFAGLPLPLGEDGRRPGEGTPGGAAGPAMRPVPPGDGAMAWLIARRAAAESLRDRLSLLVGLFFALVLPVGVLLSAVRPAAAGAGDGLAATLEFYLLVVAVLPAFSAIGIAAGQFAGEKERGLLTPLLAAPASNLAIFGGKVLGAVIPPLGYAAVAEVIYLLGLALLLGPAALGLLLAPLGAAAVLLVPAVTCFAAAVASLISSRVRTYNAAQQLAGLVLMPVWGLVLGAAARLNDWGPAALFGGVAALFVLDLALAALAAATWRREEVLAQR